MKCSYCGFNFKQKQMTLEAYNRMLWRKTCIRYFDKNEKKRVTIVLRKCDACERRGVE